ALLLTEFGATNDLAILTGMADRADRFMVGWQEWHYCGCDDPTTSGPGDKQAIVRDPHKPPEGANLDTSKLGALTRPRPQAVAGTASSFAFEPGAKRFTLVWSTKRADGAGSFAAGAVTEISLPARVYPSGYAADVQGGRVVSRAGEDV